MSLILDALRRGRGTQAPRRNPNNAQTDAVLKTLADRRINPATSANGVKRILLYGALALALGTALWLCVMWVSEG